MFYPACVYNTNLSYMLVCSFLITFLLNPCCCFLKFVFSAGSTDVGLHFEYVPTYGTARCVGRWHRACFKSKPKVITRTRHGKYACFYCSSCLEAVCSLCYFQSQKTHEKAPVINVAEVAKLTEMKSNAETFDLREQVALLISIAYDGNKTSKRKSRHIMVFSK